MDDVLTSDLIFKIHCSVKNIGTKIICTYLLKFFFSFTVLEDHVNQAIRLCMLNGSMEKFSYESLALVIMKFILNKSSTF